MHKNDLEERVLIDVTYKELLKSEANVSIKVLDDEYLEPCLNNIIQLKDMYPICKVVLSQSSCNFLLPIR